MAAHAQQARPACSGTQAGLTGQRGAGKGCGALSRRQSQLRCGRQQSSGRSRPSCGLSDSERAALTCGGGRARQRFRGCCCTQTGICVEGPLRLRWPSLAFCAVGWPHEQGTGGPYRSRCHGPIGPLTNVTRQPLPKQAAYLCGARHWAAHTTVLNQGRGGGDSPIGEAKHAVCNDGCEASTGGQGRKVGWHVHAHLATRLCASAWLTGKCACTKRSMRRCSSVQHTNRQVWLASLLQVYRLLPPVTAGCPD